MNIWHGLAKDRVSSERFETLIEIPRGGKAKYELDKQTGLLRLDRILFTSTVYPANYGFIPLTLAEDGDPLDVLVLCDDSIYPNTLVTCAPIGVIKMLDNGQPDEKVIAVAVNDPVYNVYGDISQLPKHIFVEMTHFFEVYKELENKRTAVQEVCNRAEAVKIIKKCMELYQREYGEK
ncbi:MAG: inorganic diphosphatase [Candidatus Coproplasma sp.]